MYIVESYCCTAEISTIIVNIEKTPQNCLIKQRKRAYKQKTCHCSSVKEYSSFKKYSKIKNRGPYMTMKTLQILEMPESLFPITTAI